MNNITWILVADAANARIFSTHKASLFNGDGKTLTLVDTYEHSASRKLDSELVSDKQGRFGHATFSERTDPHKHEEDVFALELAKHLIKAHAENEYQELIFIAPPTFMGMLNKHITSQLNKIVSLKVEKNYTQCNAHEITERLQEHL